MGQFGEIDSFTNRRFVSNEQVLENGKYQSIGNSIHSTISPQKGFKNQDPRPRNLESQPHQIIGEPLQANLDTVRRQRYGRPNTNSPFPYMQKRNSKSKQFPLPSTAATSNMNQQIIINELQTINGRHSGMQPTINSSLLQNDASNNTYINQNNQLNMVEESSFLNSSIGGLDNSTYPLNLNNFQDEISQFQSSFSQNGVISSEMNSSKKITLIKEKEQFSQSKNQPLLDTPNINIENLSLKRHGIKEVTQSIFHQKDVKSQITRKRKVATEPNSPTNALSDSIQNQFNNNRVVQMNNEIIIGREASIRLSANKLSLIKSNPINQKVKIQRQNIECLYKINNSLEDSNGLGLSLLASEPLHNMLHNGIFNETQTDDKAGHFLPRLDINNRYSNSQVQYRESNEQNRSDIKERLEMSGKSPINTWFSEQQNKKPSLSQDRKIQNIQVTQNSTDFNKFFKPIKQVNAKSTKANNRMNQSSFLNGVQNQIDASPQYLPSKDFSEIYSGSGKSGIGKVQPVPEIKTQFNEQMIRNKLNRDKNLMSETPHKLDMSLININKGSNGSMIPFSEVTSPSNVNQGSPLVYQNLQLRNNGKILGREQQAYNPSKFYQIENYNRALNNASELSEQFNSTNGFGQGPNSQFHNRNYSVSHGSSKEFQEKVQSKNGHFNTQYKNSMLIHFFRIEDAIRGSKDSPQKDRLQSIIQNQSNIDVNYLARKSNSVVSNEDKLIQKQAAHHSIKTVASKQMPKCFRMSKQQVHQVTRVYNKGGANTTTNNKIQPIEGTQIQPKFESTFYVHHKTTNNQRSISNDARISFNNDFTNQYNTLQKQEQTITYQTPVRQSIKFAQNILNETKTSSHSYKIQVDQLDSDRDKERMTPAFNARQSYH